jgi:HAD superfamily hydrolase (TIGR01662 family)
MIIASPKYDPDPTQNVLGALQQLGWPTVTPTVAAAIFEATRVRIPTSRMMFPDALATLAELRERGFLLGIVTNRAFGGPPFLEDIREMGLLDYFAIPHIAISADLGMRKPSAGIFQYALNALNVTAQESVMVGDSLRADVLGAQQLGIFTVWRPKSKVQVAASKIANASVEFAPDDYLIAQSNSLESQRYRVPLSEIKPDAIIKQTSDLLELFHQAGVQ